MPLKQLLAPVANDLLAVNHVITDRLSSKVELINQISGHIIHAGGKRLRPTTTLLAAGIVGGGGGTAHRLAAVVEFIHTATLLHDDVVDNTNLRRGRITANAQWSNSSAVLSGDFLYSRAFQIMVEVGHMDVMRVMADTTNAIAEGEVLQLLNARNPGVTEASYFKVIELKTAVLFGAAAELGAIAANATPSQQAALGRYGTALGIAYQLADDVLDYTGNSAESGKAVGNDLAEGKPTLPLIYTLQNSSSEIAELIKTIIRNGELGTHADSLLAVQSAIESSGAIAYTQTLAERHAAAAKQAISEFPDSPYKMAMMQLADFAISRTH